MNNPLGHLLPISQSLSNSFSQGYFCQHETLQAAVDGTLSDDELGLSRQGFAQPLMSPPRSISAYCQAKPSHQNFQTPGKIPPLQTGKLAGIRY
jgi:hypothetical protein